MWDSIRMEQHAWRFLSMKALVQEFYGHMPFVFCTMFSQATCDFSCLWWHFPDKALWELFCLRALSQTGEARSERELVSLRATPGVDQWDLEVGGWMPQPPNLCGTIPRHILHGCSGIPSGIEPPLPTVVTSSITYPLLIFPSFPSLPAPSLLFSGISSKSCLRLFWPEPKLRHLSFLIFVWK